jgi:DNA-binding response OmpR family regulator
LEKGGGLVGEADHARILRLALIGDDVWQREGILKPQLSRYGFKVISMSGAAEFLKHLPAPPFGMAIIDAGLPDEEGFSLARKVHVAAPHIGIVMLSGRNESFERIRGLNEGADTYLSKPVELDVLAATLHSLARRLSNRRSAEPGRWKMPPDGWRLLTPHGSSIGLTHSERIIMSLLMTASGRVVSRSELITLLTDDVDRYDSHRLESLIYRLRRKVRDHSGESLPLTAVPAVGYIFTAGEAGE